MKWGFFSYGHIAPKIHESLKLIPSQEIVAIASKSNHIELTQIFKNELTVYNNYESLCADPSIDIIYISSTHNFHYEHTMMCLNAGKHVICEKPLSLNATQTNEMILLAKESKRFLMEALWMVYLPAVAECKKRIDNGEIGEIKMITANFSFDSKFDESHRCLNPILAGGGIYDVGVYPLAFANMMIGETPSIIQSMAQLTDRAVDIVASMQLKYPSGAMAQLFCGVQLESEHQATIYGTEGRIIVPSFWKGQSLIIVKKEKEKIIELPFTSTGYYHELLHACKQISAGQLESSIFGWNDSINQAMMLDSILAQVKYGK